MGDPRSLDPSIGERDGVQGPAIAQCLLAAGAEIAYVTTECFV